MFSLVNFLYNVLPGFAIIIIIIIIIIICHFRLISPEANCNIYTTLNNFHEYVTPH